MLTVFQESIRSFKKHASRSRNLSVLIQAVTSGWVAIGYYIQLVGIGMIVEGVREVVRGGFALLKNKLRKRD